MTDKYLQPHDSERLQFAPLSSELIQEWKIFLADKSAIMHFPANFREDDLMAEKWIKGQLRRYAEVRFGLLAAFNKKNNEFVGQIGLISQLVDDVVELEIGYHLMPKHRGNGYATEAAIYFKQFAKTNTKADSVVSFIHPKNKPSQRVAMRNEMKIDGQTLHHDVLHDVWRFRFS